MTVDSRVAAAAEKSALQTIASVHGVDSLRLAKLVIEKLGFAGFEIVHRDAMPIAADKSLPDYPERRGRETQPDHWDF